MSDRYPENVSFRVPNGWRAKLEALADAEERTLAEFLRETVRRLLAAAEKRTYRKRKAARR